MLNNGPFAYDLRCLLSHFHQLGAAGKYNAIREIILYRFVEVAKYYAYIAFGKYINMFNKKKARRL
jgi:hypothetical protein